MKLLLACPNLCSCLCLLLSFARTGVGVAGSSFYDDDEGRSEEKVGKEELERLWGFEVRDFFTLI